MPDLADLLAGAGKDWQPDTPPVADAELEAAKARIGRPLPDKLLELYSLCDGGEGSLPKQPYNFVLWGIVSLAETREHEHYRAHYDRYVLFGSSGGGEYFGLDETGRVFFMDPIAGEESIIVYCDTFDEFVTHIGVLRDEESMQ
jgi:hypothetical protein